jgi:hypothetical protein
MLVTCLLWISEFLTYPTGPHRHLEDKCIAVSELDNPNSTRELSPLSLSGMTTQCRGHNER